MKKGFTLIELLAVIVILAIIALIATPIVLNIISDVKESSIEASKKIYIRAVEQTIISENTIRPFNPTKCEVIENGNLNCDTGFLEVEVDNTVPIKGTLTIVEGKVVSDTLVFKEETNKENEYALKSVATTSEEYGIESVNSCATSGICEAGTPFAIKVNDKETYKFYVISDNGNEVNLIMNRDLGNGLNWIEEDDYTLAGGTDWNYESCNWTYTGNYNRGPLTALNYLESLTSKWTNINSYDYILEDDSDTPAYPPLKRTNVRSRMLTKTEAESLGCTDSDGTCPEYLYENTDIYIRYWLSTAFSPDYYNCTDGTTSPIFNDAWWVSPRGCISRFYSVYYDIEDRKSNGVRPVIKISK